MPAGAEGKSPTESAEDAARREQEKRLERSLNEASMQDLVQRAMDGMKTAAERLTDAKDPGLGTQRVQEDVVRTLDRLLEEAQKRQGKKSSSSKKKQQQKQGQRLERLEALEAQHLLRYFNLGRTQVYHNQQGNLFRFRLDSSNKDRVFQPRESDWNSEPVQRRKQRRNRDRDNHAGDKLRSRALFHSSQLETTPISTT